MPRSPFVSRRAFLGSVAFSAAALSVPGALAEELLRTPRQTEGPFYPDRLPLDTDNDLLIINDALNPAVGEITHLGGRILGPTGSRSATRWWRSGRWTTGGPICTRKAETAKSETGTSKALAAS